MQSTGGPAPQTATTIDAWAFDVLTSLTALPGVRRVGLALAEGGGRRLRFTASDRDNESAPDWCHVDAYDDVPLNTAVRTGQLVAGALDDLGPRYAGFIERQQATSTVALAAVPIVAAGQTVGGCVLFFDQLQAFDDPQRRDLVRRGAVFGDSLRLAQRNGASPKQVRSPGPLPPGARVAMLDVTPEPASVAEARRFVRSTLADWGVDEEAIFTAALCLSELVTNVVIHAHANCEVRIVLDDGVLSTTVRDYGACDSTATESLDDPLRVHGRGLQLVDSLASRWGSDLDSLGSTVWFVLDL